MDDDTAPLPRESLEIGAELGRGGQATVYRVDRAPGTEPMLLKEYLVPVDEAALDRVIEWRTGLGELDRRVIDASTSWPRRRVTVDSRTVGVLIPEAPASFSVDIRGSRRLRELSYLSHAERSKNLGIDVPDSPTRLDILARLSSVFDVLQRNSVVHGDISFKNVLWSVDPTPGAYLLDCDSVTIGGQPAALPMATTPHWTDPRLINGDITAPDLDSDRLALGLAVYRVYFQTAGNLRDNDPALPIPDHPPIDDYTRTLFERSLTMTTPRVQPEEWGALDDLAIDLRDPDHELHRQMISYVPESDASADDAIPVFSNTAPRTAPPSTTPAAGAATPGTPLPPPTSTPPPSPQPASAPATATASAPASGLDATVIAVALAIFVACAVASLLLTRALV